MPPAPTDPAAHVAGTGPDIVLLHGLGSRWQVFAPILDELAQEHRVHALDLPGFGARPADPALRPGVDALADWVTAELDARGVTAPHVVGSSLGGGIALELARRGVAGRVTAFAPIGFWNPRERAWCLGLLTVLRTAARRLPRPLGAALRTRTGRRLLLFPLFGRPSRVTAPAAIEDLHALAVGEGFGPVRRALRSQRAIRGGDEVPTTIVWGRRDLVLPAQRQSRRARQLRPQATHVLLGGCGHLPFSDSPARCVAVITDRHPLSPHRQDRP
ncbi:alpha/beta fold hydrolase [Microbacterium sp. Sa4CUA7]|uniref:Alpha/beta fold hydrolase n=1 Tax=Microbacterium pullorum TaxID=2762236 RepID=A0ABR8S406_9MICO|nr:alpha/beta fold hydrolase [Microbacterium pullorum]